MGHKTILTYRLQKTLDIGYKDLGYAKFLTKSHKILCKVQDLKSQKMPKSQNWNIGLKPL